MLVPDPDQSAQRAVKWAGSLVVVLIVLELLIEHVRRVADLVGH